MSFLFLFIYFFLAALEHAACLLVCNKLLRKRFSTRAPRRLPAPSSAARPGNPARVLLHPGDKSSNECIGTRHFQFFSSVSGPSPRTHTTRNLIITRWRVWAALVLALGKPGSEVSSLYIFFNILLWLLLTAGYVQHIPACPVAPQNTVLLSSSSVTSLLLLSVPQGRPSLDVPLPPFPSTEQKPVKHHILNKQKPASVLFRSGLVAYLMNSVLV